MASASGALIFLSLLGSSLLTGVAFRNCAQHGENIVDICRVLIVIASLEMRRELRRASGLAGTQRPQRCQNMREALFQPEAVIEGAAACSVPRPDIRLSQAKRFLRLCNRPPTYACKDELAPELFLRRELVTFCPVSC